MEFKNTKTYQNLIKAFNHETNARVKYGFFEGVAKESELQEVADIFSTISDNESEHAEIWYKYINNGLADTSGNLEISINDEHIADVNYDIYSKEAKEEGFEHLSFLFKEVGKIEEKHEAIFSKLLYELNTDTMFKKNHEVCYECMKCGHIHYSKDAPCVCPVCNHSMGFFKTLC